MEYMTVKTYEPFLFSSCRRLQVHTFVFPATKSSMRSDMIQLGMFQACFNQFKNFKHSCDDALASSHNFFFALFSTPYSCCLYGTISKIVETESRTGTCANHRDLPMRGGAPKCILGTYVYYVFPYSWHQFLQRFILN